MTDSVSTDTPFDPTARAAQADAAEKKRALKNAQQALVQEFNTLVSDTESLLKQTSETAGSQVDELRNKITENLARAKDVLQQSEESIREQSRVAVQATEDYVHSHPLQSVGIAAGVGFLLGLLVARR
jgi:ElaB/YqjD/DUF883 family membrane-anchored ribosome-binding protein